MVDAARIAAKNGGVGKIKAFFPSKVSIIRNKSISLHKYIKAINHGKTH
jgi:hypothetical protein